MSTSAMQGGHKNLMSSLVALYSVQPGNRLSPFLQPRSVYGAQKLQTSTTQLNTKKPKQQNPTKPH